MKIPHLPFWAWTLGGVLTILAFNAAVTLPTYTTTKKEFCVTCHHQQKEPSFWDQSTLHPKINCSECHATGHALCRASTSFPCKAEGSMPVFLPNSTRSIRTASAAINVFSIWNGLLPKSILTISASRTDSTLNS